jgi:hypothetical protein
MLVRAIAPSFPLVLSGTRGASAQGSVWVVDDAPEPGDFVWPLLTLLHAPGRYLDGYASALLLDPSFLVVAIGFTPESGTLVQDYVAVDTGVIPHVPLVAQAAFLDTSFGFWLSGPSVTAIVGDGPDN